MPLYVICFLLLLPGPSALPADPCKLGAEALARRELVQAEAYLKQCLKSHPAELFPYIQLCALYQAQGNADALHQVALLGLKRFPQEKRFYLSVGNGAGQQGHYERAIEVFSEAFKRWPDDSRLRKGLASAHASEGMEFLDKNNNEMAEKHLRRAVKLDPEDIEAQLNLGRALHNLNRSVEALATFDRVLALNARQPLAHFHRGMVLYGMGDYDAAISNLRIEIETNPDHPPSYLFLGMAYLAKADWASALTDLETAALRMPDNAKAQYSRARCLYHLGRLKEAEEAYRKTIELDPTDPGPANSLGRLLLESGRGKEAEEMFERAALLSKKLRSAVPGEIRFESPQRRKPE